MTRPQRREEKEKCSRDFAAFCRITRQYFPEFISWQQGIKDSGKFWTYETEVMLITVILKNICSTSSMQKMTDEFLDEGCVENLCRVLGVGCHEFLPHYMTINELLSRLETGELEQLRKNMIRALLRRRKFEGARFLGEC